MKLNILKEWTVKEWADAIKSGGPTGANDWLLSEIGFGGNKIVGDYQIGIVVSSDSFEEENAIEKNYYPVGEKIIIDGQEGIKYVGESEEVEPVIKIINVLVPCDDKTLIFFYNEAPNQTDKSEIFNQMLSTFKFLEIPIEILIDGERQKIEGVQLPIDESEAKTIVKKFCQPTMGKYGYDDIKQIDNIWRIRILNVSCVCAATVNIDTGKTECNWEFTY